MHGVGLSPLLFCFGDLDSFCCLWMIIGFLLLLHLLLFSSSTCQLDSSCQQSNLLPDYPYLYFKS